MTLRKRLAVFVASAIVAGTFAAPAVAWNHEPPGHDNLNCNAGRGNGSEGCDPGNSSTSADGSTGQNQGGDECGPIQGGTAACPDKP
jgi:hypothetical protein